VGVQVGKGEGGRWRAVLGRDARFDGAFVYAVRSTGVYCRPSCPSRRPRRASVVFFDLPRAAEGAGFRSCRRCRPADVARPDPRALRVERVCRYIDQHLEGALPLARLAREAGLSAYHFQRTFKQLMGISPRQYAEARRLASFKTQVRKGETVTSALYGAGYGSGSRLYERAARQLGMTPAAYRKGGRGMRLRYTVGRSPLGCLLVAATSRGIAAVSLGDSEATLEATLRAEYPAAEIERDDQALAPRVRDVVRRLAGGRGPMLPLDINATAFQWRVWQELLRIPAGSTRTYGEVARALGQPKAARAVARACATNPVALVIPCHRVVAGDGGLGGYRWGAGRKRQLLEREKDAASGEALSTGRGR
jgi:AraC family transcriptional regulator, regulatory protein of adaptative response / methylated-DNA-[protein]-cysteine methyltransferase